jgi:hypothetical protein
MSIQRHILPAAAMGTAPKWYRSLGFAENKAVPVSRRKPR